MDYIISAPGKVILFGEHAAVFGKPAIAAAIDLRTYLLVETSTSDTPTVTLEFPDIHLNFKVQVDKLASLTAQTKADHLNWSTPKTLDRHIFDSLSSLALLEEPGLTKVQQAAVVSFLYLYIHLCPPSVCADSSNWVVRSTLPIGAGLGSSASICVCLAAGLLVLNGQLSIDQARDFKSLTEKQLSLVDDWSFVGEMCIHGNPSGIDNAVATQGGALLFQRPNNRVPLVDIPEMKLLLTNTKHPRSTADLVGGVGVLTKEFGSIMDPIMTSVGEISNQAMEIISRGKKVVDQSNLEIEEGILPQPTSEDACNVMEDGATLQKLRDIGSEMQHLVRINHGLLIAMGVSHPKLEIIRTASIVHDLGETKLTGAGGGGCAITLVTSKDKTAAQLEDNVIAFTKEMATHGFEVHETTIGARGVGMCIDHPSLKTVEAFKKVERADLKNIGPWTH